MVRFCLLQSYFMCILYQVAAASKLPRLQVKSTQLVNSSGKKVQQRYQHPWSVLVSRVCKSKCIYFYEEKLEGKCSASCHVYC